MSESNKTKLSGDASPWQPSAPKSSLSAGAAPFAPGTGKKTTLPVASKPSAPLPPTPMTGKPASEVAANSGLSATAAPYSPARLSPTAKGTPAFPVPPTTATTAAPVAEGPAAIGHGKEAPQPVSPVALSTDGASLSTNAAGATSSSSSEISNFASSTLVVKTPKQAAPAGEAPKFSYSWGLICNNHLDPKNYTGIEIRRVGDIEQFWRLWHHVPLFSSKVSTSAGSAYTYHWFKGTIKPSWEDPSNVAGGILTVTVVPGDRISFLDDKGRVLIDDMYMSILMLVTGAAKPAVAVVNGVTIKSRNGVALDLWLDTTEVAKIKALAEAVREAIGPLDERFEKERFAYMSNAQRAAAPPPTTGYKGKVIKAEKKIDYY